MKPPPLSEQLVFWVSLLTEGMPNRRPEGEASRASPAEAERLLPVVYNADLIIIEPWSWIIRVGAHLYTSEFGVQATDLTGSGGA